MWWPCTGDCSTPASAAPGRTAGSKVEPGALGGGGLGQCIKWGAAALPMLRCDEDAYVDRGVQPISTVRFGFAKTQAHLVAAGAPRRKPRSICKGSVVHAPTPPGRRCPSAAPHLRSEAVRCLSMSQMHVKIAIALAKSLRSAIGDSAIGGSRNSVWRDGAPRPRRLTESTQRVDACTRTQRLVVAIHRTYCRWATAGRRMHQQTQRL